MPERLVLGGDVGATKTLLAVAAADGDHLRIVREQRYADRAFPDFATLVAKFLGEASASVERACFGVAGPIEGRRVEVTNFPWRIDADALAAVIGAPVLLANDFAAAARGVDLLEPREIATLQPGEPLARAPQLVIGAGTGLGVAYRVWSGHRYLVVAGEGGHVGFAPADERQADLWRAARRELGRVRVEDLVSGPGLVRIYDFVRAGGGEPRTAEEIAEAALAGGDPAASDALDVFVECYGAAAGDHALAILARGGVYLAGGIAPKILPRLRSGPFLAGFNAKGVYAGLAACFPVHVVLNERLGLLGAAALAASA